MSTKDKSPEDVMLAGMVSTLTRAAKVMCSDESLREDLEGTWNKVKNMTDEEMKKDPHWKAAQVILPYLTEPPYFQFTGFDDIIKDEETNITQGSVDGRDGVYLHGVEPGGEKEALDREVPGRGDEES